MDIVTQHFFIELAIYATAAALTFAAGWWACRLAHRCDAKRAADKAWRMAETLYSRRGQH